MTDVLLVCSGGGHLKQLNEISQRIGIAPERQHWVTFENGLSSSLLAGRTVTYVPFVAPRDVRNLARVGRVARRLLREREYQAVVSTGAAPALAFLPYATRRGYSAHYIESATRAEGPSMSGKLLARWCPNVNTYTQYPQWESDRWRYRGSIFDAFTPGPTAPTTPVIRRAVVSVGTQDGYQFDRLYRGLTPLLKDADEVLWQTGPQDVSAYGIAGRASVPHHELSQAIAEADVVVSHAGTGSVLTALEHGKCPVLIPRRASFDEHIDDHQVQIAREMERRGLALAREADALRDVDLLEAAGRSTVGVAAPQFLLEGFSAKPDLRPDPSTPQL